MTASRFSLGQRNRLPGPGRHVLVARLDNLGDDLIVCLNSDRSVRRLKGDGRPLQPEHDRRAVLLALDAVDAVAVFGDNTPLGVLARLRPHVFVKGGDYAASRSPRWPSAPAGAERPSPFPT